MSGFNALQAQAYEAAARRRHAQQFAGMSAYDRHKKMVRDLAAYYGRRLGGAESGGEEGAPGMKTDYEVLKDAYRFIRTEADDSEDSWEVRLARRYYSKLYREYCLADLSRHKEGRLGLRWRTQKEVVAGKGQFVCGAVGCEERRGLASFEVPFSYQEAGERKQALVKLRVCPTHAYQLNYRKNKEAEEEHSRQERKEAKRAKRRKRRRRSGQSSSEAGSSEDSESGGEGSDGSGGRRECRRWRSAGRDETKAAAGEGLPADQAPNRGAANPADAAAQQGDGFEEFFAGLFE